MIDLNLSDLETMIAIIAGSLPIIFAIYKGLVKMLSLVKKKYISTKNFINELGDCVKLVNTELKPNHGSSIKDAISRIDNKISIIDLKNRAYLSHMEVPVIELDSNGNLQWTNRAGFKLFGKDLSELLNFGWFGCIINEQRDTVEAEILDCIRQKRACSINFKIKTNKKDMDVTLDVSPIVINGNLNGFFGIIRSLDNSFMCPFLQIQKENEGN